MLPLTHHPLLRPPHPPLQIMARHRMASHSAFARLSSKLLHHEPPCMSEAEDWESSAGFLAEEHLAKPRQSTPDRLHLERTVTMASGEGRAVCGEGCWGPSDVGALG